MIQNTNTSSIETQRNLRIQKLEKLRHLGIDPFPAESRRDYTLKQVKENFEELAKKNIPLVEVSNSKSLGMFESENLPAAPLTTVTLAGRLKSKRGSGKISFATVEDESLPAGFQFVFKKDELPGEKRIWELNIGSQESWNRLIAGTKSIDIRALNPEYTQALYSQFQVNEVVILTNKNTKQKNHYLTTKVTFFKNLEEAFDANIDFTKATNLQSNYTFHQLKAYYLEKLGQEYLNKIEQNGLVLLELHPFDYKLTFSDLRNLLDEGDYIQATGSLDVTIAGEPSLFVQEFVILTKSLRPLPEGLEDKEQLFRERYLDMRLHPELRELYRQKGKFWTATKEFMDSRGFTQVFAPIMQSTTGGAEADPFVTHHNALDEDFYLGISPELHLKRMVVGGLEKIYDLGRNFRNEGIDDDHLQEFSRIEFYWAYANHENLMNFTEELMKHALKAAFGTLELEYKFRDEKGNFTGQSQRVNWDKPWPRMPYFEFIKHFGGIDLSSIRTLKEVQTLAQQHKISFEENDSFGRIVDRIYKKTARIKCVEPVWMIDVPTRLSPLAKRSPNNPDITLRSHLVAYCSELTNGFAELNDPLDQLERFQEQQAARDGGDDEAMMLDMDFVKALEIGMPPTVGFAYSERLFDLVANQTMREASTFPLMRKEDKESNSKSKSTIVNHILVLENLKNWQKANAYSHLSASFGARTGKSLFTFEHLDSSDGQKINMNIGSAILNKIAADSESLKQLKMASEKAKLNVEVFTEEMQETTDDSRIKEIYLGKNYEDIKLLGILISGKKSEVEKLTQDFPLFE